MKRVVFSVFAAAVMAIGIEGAAQQLMVHRNDGKFHTVALDRDFSMEHLELDGGMAVKVSGSDMPVPMAEPALLSAIDSCVVRISDIPSLFISFPDYPDVGQIWDKAMYLDAVMDVKGNGTCEDANGFGLKVKGRGNSSWLFPKKPMRLKFPAKTSLCGLRKAKNFVLLADYVDHTMMHNDMAHWLAGELGVPYACSFRRVNVYINGNYSGLYFLTHKIGINSASVDIDEASGILFEMSSEFDEKYQFRSELVPVMVKDPDFDELYEEDSTGMAPDERLQMWRDDYLAAEHRALQGEGFEAFDLNSFVNYLLLNYICGNNEVGYPKSVYVSKTHPGEDARYVFGPAWDFDVSMNFSKPDGNGGRTVTSPEGMPWNNGLFAALIKSDGFKEAFSSRFAEFERDIFPRMVEYLGSEAELLAPSSMLDGQRWDDTGSHVWYYRETAFDCRKNVEELRKWLIDRVAFLKTALDSGKLF